MKKVLALGLIAGVVAAPAAFAAKPAHKPAPPSKQIVSYLFKGKVLSHDDPGVVVVSPVKGTNVFGRRALAGVDPNAVNVKIAAGTKLFSRIVKSDGTKSFVRESSADIKAGDVVFFHIRAPKGTKAPDFAAAAKWMRDFTPNPAPAG